MRQLCCGKNHTFERWSLLRIARHFNVRLVGVRCILQVFNETDNVMDSPLSGQQNVPDRDIGSLFVEEARRHSCNSNEDLRGRQRQEHNANALVSTASRPR